MKVIDADAHVYESPDTWSHLDPSFQNQRPLPIKIDLDTPYGRHNAFWLIEGKAFPKMAGRGLHIFGTPTISESALAKPMTVGAQTLTDVQDRLADMDRLRIDCQVVFPTLFLVTLPDDVGLEAALCRAYNSYMAAVCARSGGRIRFSAVVPLRDVDEAVRELRRAKDLGAVAVMTLGLVWNMELGNRCFFSFYAEAERLELPLCVHFGWGGPGLTDAFQALESSSFSAAMLPVVMGFHSIISQGVLDEFPRLRVAFLEAGSEWLIYAVRQMERSWHDGRFRCKRAPGQYLRDGNVYVSVEADEDIPYLVNLIGEDQLVIASDYPHEDASREEEMVRQLEDRADISPSLREKILGRSAERLYGM